MIHTQFFSHRAQRCANLHLSRHNFCLLYGNGIEEWPEHLLVFIPLTNKPLPNHLPLSSQEEEKETRDGGGG